MKDWLSRILKVPSEPALPPGSATSALVFRAGRNFYRLLMLQWIVKQIVAVFGIIMSLVFLKVISADWSASVRTWVSAAEYTGIALYAVQLPFTWLMVRLNYKLRWYIVTDRSLRIRWGLVRIREMTMTFANIQHLAVRQGPLQRLLGIYDLQVRTAGGGGATEDRPQQGSESASTHIGYFHGVENAPAIRDLIVDRMREVRDAGLGETRDESDATVTESFIHTKVAGEFRTALAEVRAEIARLRDSLGERKAVPQEPSEPIAGT